MFDQPPSDEFRFPTELAAFERQLADMTPTAPRMDRDRLMFAAGQASAKAERIRLGVRVWPAAAATLAAALIALAAVVVWQSKELAAMKQHDTAAAMALAGTDEPIAEDRATEYGEFANRWPRLDRTPPGYLGLRYVALTRGVGALDRVSAVERNRSTETTPPATSRTLLKELLPQATASSS